MLDDFFLKWFLAQTILKEMAFVRSRIMHFYTDGNAFFNKKNNIHLYKNA